MKTISSTYAYALKSDAAWYQQQARLEARDAFYYLEIGSLNEAARYQNKAHAYARKAQEKLVELINSVVA
jgi:hypothetical protein